MNEWFYWKIRNPIWFFYHRNLMPKLRGHKPMKWGIYLPLLSAKFWANRLQEMQFGQLVFGKIQIIVNLTILLKVFDAPKWMYVIGLFFVAFMLWFVGRFLEKKGVRRYFREAEFKDVRLK